jgi:HNH endonuclease/NUMOD4 motif
MREVWKKIDYDGVPDYYEVSNFGGVRSLAYVDRRGWRRKPYLFKFSNAEVGLTLENGTTRSFAVAQLVLLAFEGPPQPGQYLARHLDDDRTNNYLSNLAWGTDSDNHADAIRNGRSFVSYGHLGKTHSEATKQHLRNLRLGKPTGRKMTDAHKAAIQAGYRKKFPEKIKIATSCMCGCGNLAKAGSKFIHGHAGISRFRKIATDRIGKPRAW